MLSFNFKVSKNFNFILFIAVLSSLIAIAIDVLLPAYSLITAQFFSKGSGYIEHVVTFFFAGLSIGYFFAGVSTDMWGRKETIYIGLFLFVIGSLIAYYSADFETLLLGRFIQGLGAAGPRVAGIALVRDKFKGVDMAKVMSLVFTLFIVIPIFAPFLGTIIIAIGTWPDIFLFNLIIALLCMIWLYSKSKELTPEQGIEKILFSEVVNSAISLLKNSLFISLCFVSGFIFGLFLLYLGLVPELLVNTYMVGNSLSNYFALCAISMAIAAIINHKIISHLGLYKAVVYSAFGVLLTIIATWFVSSFTFFVFMISLNFILFFIGVLFSNINALIMEPIKNGRGVAIAFWGLLSNIIAATVMYISSKNFYGTVDSLFTLFFYVIMLVLITLAIARFLSYRR